MILEMREVTEANWEETKFTSWTCHGKAELVLDINSSYTSRHNYVYTMASTCA